jgi:argininosuccinate lyase
MTIDTTQTLKPVAGGKDQPPADDWRLFKAEIKVNSAYAKALAGSALSDEERDMLVGALAQIEADFDAGDLTTAEADPRTFLDERLAEGAGDAAEKFFAARANAESDLTALRMWLLDEIERIVQAIADIQKALIQQAESHVGTLMPGYIHLQPAQPVSCAHWLLSYFWMLARDQDRLTAAIGRAGVSPLGSGLLAGSPHALDRRALATAMGFGEVTPNSIDAVSDLDFAAEFLFIAALIGAHLNRLASDLILYSNPTLGFVVIDADYISGVGENTTDTTIERARGQTGRLLGEMTGLLSALQALPGGYVADTHEARRTLYAAIDMLNALCETIEGALISLDIRPDRMLDALTERLLASDLTDYLVERGVKLREARQIVNRLLDQAETKNTTLGEMNLQDLQAHTPKFDSEVFVRLDYTRSAARHATIGGTAPAAIRAQLRQALDWLIEAGLE